jgi:hypothetical protein
VEGADLAPALDQATTGRLPDGPGLPALPPASSFGPK